ncbi:SpoIIE family protein phosphatase [Streptomyces sp. NPDC020489]|uniref:SpoIIE family protein phosphatase n=1 Tax=Streptomyces sp. NPDC020489 TaxID=3365077 RepID=UPI0037AA2B65
MSRVWDIPVHDSTRVRDVRVAAESASAHAGLTPHRTAAAALVATELATNLLKHAGGGHILINLVDRVPAGPDAHRTAVQLLALDHGPGIADVSAALRDGHSTVDASLGAGLGTCMRVSNDFDLHSTPGRGTVAVARIDHEPPSRHHRAQQRPRGPRAGGVNVSLARAEFSGDTWSWARSAALTTLMLADGLGHGAKAAEASNAAAAELARACHLPPSEILRRLHARLRTTRGAAVAVAQLDTDAQRLCFAGVGNIGARLDTVEGWRPLLSHPGIVGAHFPRTVPVQRVTWHPDSLLVLHSDGLPSRWTPPNDAVLLTRDPAVVAAAILRNAGSDARPVRDDTSVAVLAPDERT